MKKVIIAFDGSHFSEGAFEFARRLNETDRLLLTGVFLPAVDYVELLYSFGGVSGPMYYADVNLEETGILQKNIDRFKSLCEKNGIEYRVHPDVEKHVVSEVKLESRYADLMLLGCEQFYENLGEEGQDDYIESILHKSECPVILVPEHCTFPDNVILAFDGSASSVYAIKQFAYLLPGFTTLTTILVSAGTDSSSVPNKDYVEEFAARHFEDLAIEELQIDARKYFDTWLEGNKNAVLVTGAYGRSAISEMFRKSFISKSIHNHKLPIFIAHK